MPNHADEVLKAWLKEQVESIQHTHMEHQQQLNLATGTASAQNTVSALHELKLSFLQARVRCREAKLEALMRIVTGQAEDGKRELETANQVDIAIQNAYTLADKEFRAQPHAGWAIAFRFDDECKRLIREHGLEKESSA